MNASESPLPDERPDPSRQLNERLAFLQLDAADRERLRSLAPIFHAHASRFVDNFYQHLFAFEETAQFLRDPQVVTWLKQAQQAHFETLLDAIWDEPYARRRVRVGQTHAHAGIEPEFFLGAYNQYLQHWVEHFAETSSKEEREKFKSLQSLIRAVLLDIGLTLDAYFLESTQKIRQALNMYWNANNELRQFAQLASHDLKTPLATVANLCDEALDEFGEQMPREAAELIEKARQRAFRMGQTIDELLACSMQIDEEQSLATIAPRAAIDEAIERVSPLAAEKGIELSIVGSFPLVRGDQARLCEVFSNLLSNAVKFIEHVEGRIEIKARSEQGECIFSVRDNGPGIPAEEVKRIFSPFRRLPQHQHVAGSGLGLYFTRNLVNQLQGRIWVESSAGEGSKFCFTVPLAK